MDLQWKIRLIDRMIKRDPNLTIKDYFRIVDQEEANEWFDDKKPEPKKDDGLITIKIVRKRYTRRSFPKTKYFK
jgi:hypothetical protein